MKNTIFYLIGDPSLPKHEVAVEIGRLTGARLVEAQAIYDVIFPLLADPESVPDAAWDQVDAVRGAILATIETLSPKDLNFVFTHAGFDIPADLGVYRKVREVAKRRGARFLPARFTGGQGKRPLMTFDEKDAPAINLDDATPRQAAAHIVAAAGG